MPIPTDLESATAAELQDALTAGSFTAVQLVEAYLARIAELSANGPRLNSVRALNPSAVMDAAASDTERAAGTIRGILHGIPVLIKDNIDVEGMPTTAGSLALANSFPRTDAALIARLRDAGAIILGKTNLTEFANYMTHDMPSGYSSLGGQVLNPYDLSQTPSGSSAGSGSAAATSLATLTVGTETSGSILSPARANSLVGVKPTVGLVSRTGIIPISASQDTAGPMTRTVMDAAALLTVIAGPDAEDPTTLTQGPAINYTAGLSSTALRGARLGYIVDPDPVFVAALAALKLRGATLVPVILADTDQPQILSFEFKRDLNHYLDRLSDDAPMKSLAEIIAFNLAHENATLKFGQTLLVESNAVDLNDPAQLSSYENMRDSARTDCRRSIDHALTGRVTDNDSLGEDTAREAHNAHETALDAIVSNCATTQLGARAGYPTVVVPSGYAAANRRPEGLAFLGTAFSEQRLLGFAYDFEQSANAWRPPATQNPSLLVPQLAPPAPLESQKP